MNGSHLTVSALGARAGVSADTVRYYERAGLLPAPQRTAVGYRIYGPEAADRLLFIQGAQRLGLRLREIRDLLAVRDTGQCPCEPAEQMLRRRIGEVDAEMARLAALRAELERMLAGIPAPDCPDPAPGTWLPEGGDPMTDETAPVEAPAAGCCCDDPQCPPEACGNACC
ncbi:MULTISPECIES: heavy metal-responsive transcriptional regulator [unclassified Streptomyces]|uniref:heavy metal-responsive transcriptional regulator n=1 Tax=unclassified Streptomyces TaxID=2593676 RepID=UPI0033ACD7F5